jgi:4-amino-4-deoxy-L-arabinose transferase-like glycosyltransferase
MGLACMTKGIAAIALTGLIVFGFIIIRRELNALRDMAWFPGLLIFSLIVVPWHLAVGSLNPEFAHFYFVVQHFGRLVSEEHSKPVWYLLIIFPFGMLFWTALFFPAIANAFKRSIAAIKLPVKSYRDRGEGECFSGAKNRDQEAGETEGVLFLIIWVVAVVGLFSLSRSKLVPYILPAYPAMALLIASHLTNGGLARSSARWCAGITAALLLILIPVVSHYAQSQDMLPLSELIWPVRAAQSALLFGSVMLGIAAFKRRLIPAATGLVLVVLIPTMVMIVPTVAKYRKVGGFIKAMPGPLPAQIKVAEWRNYDQGLSFYTQRRTILVDNIGELKFGSTIGNNRDFFLQGEDSLKRLAREGPLLVNLRPGDWPKVSRWGTFRPVAANSTNVMVGNRGFFRLTGLAPWPDKAVTPPPLLLMPRRLNPQESK